MAANISSVDGALAFLEELGPNLAVELGDYIEQHAPIWTPQPGPQEHAFDTEADELFFGGQAGGGKSDLLIGAALTQAKHSIIFRREATQMLGIIQRMTEILGHRDGYNGSAKVWHLDRRIVEFGSVPNPGDETRYQGRPHDLIGFDEISNFLESQFRFLKGWLRSARGHRTRVICTGNPPTTPEGAWVKEYWGPWLDPRSRIQAKPGELLWYTTGEDGKDMLCEGPDPVKVHDEWVRPKSRTFIPSAVEDNAFLLRTGYRDQLAALPEPLRSQMMRGDFSAGEEDGIWQVVPSSWVDLAMDRWSPRKPGAKGEMTALGVDVARGGRDHTILAPWHGRWVDELAIYPGSSTPNGPTVAGLVVAALRNGASAYVDLIGVGTSVVDHLELLGVPHVAVNAAKVPDDMERKMPDWKDSTGKLALSNTRTMCYWRMREMLDPAGKDPVALPPNKDLRADLCMPTWKLGARGIQVESKDDIKKRLGRSPDFGDAVVLALAGGTPLKRSRVGEKVLRLPNTGVI